MKTGVFKDLPEVVVEVLYQRLGQQTTGKDAQSQAAQVSDTTMLNQGTNTGRQKIIQLIHIT